MDFENTMNYLKVKSAVLQKYEISTEFYRVRFHSSVLGEGETPKEMQVHLRDLYEKWMVPKEKTKEQIGDVIIMEQFLGVMNPELCTWVKECNPLTSGEAAELTEAFLTARHLPRGHTPYKPCPPTPVVSSERSSTGYRYILVVCDYATRYPEAFPLKNIKAWQIVNCFIQLFSRVGIPKEIIMDQGTNFTSQLLKDVYSLLGIHGVKTSPYHSQTDGLVERFNKTLKAMLRRFV
ncbi:hypothetical protein LDENG_00236720 [Lucifuga dentata]|nr:hypothetical protein LDENG_00236720 [Lucifuga dentata]